jgi:hypothetical protein
MDNVTVAVEGSKLILTIDLSQPGSVSASGKTTVIASTRGNAQVAPGVYCGLNVYKYPPQNNR